jgi:hypothetical protein
MPVTEYCENIYAVDSPTPKPLNAHNSGSANIPQAVKLKRNEKNTNKKPDANDEQNKSNDESFSLLSRLVKNKKSSFCKVSCDIRENDTEPRIIESTKTTANISSSEYFAKKSLIDFLVILLWTLF